MHACQLSEEFSYIFYLLVFSAETKDTTDRNGSLETNESSSPEGPEHHGKHHSANAPEFDVNEFFKIDNIPGLSVSNLFQLSTILDGSLLNPRKYQVSEERFILQVGKV